MTFQDLVSQIIVAVVGVLITVGVPLLTVYIIKAAKTFADTLFHKLTLSQQQQLKEYVPVVVSAVENLVRTQQIADDIKAIKAAGIGALQKYADAHHIKVDVNQLEIEFEAALNSGIKQANG